MKVNELLDKKPHGGTESENEGNFYVSKKIGDREIVFSAIKGSRNTWEVVFHEVQDGKTSYEKTGSGDEVKVFAFVLNAVRTFVDKHEPKEIHFDAEVKDTGRVGLYRKLVSRFAKNYYAREFEVGLGRAVKRIQFDLVLKPSDLHVKEALDKAVEFEITEKTPAFFQAEFISNGRTIVFDADASYFYSDDEDNQDDYVWEISFIERMKNGMARWDISRGGKEFEVFATIKKIIEKFYKIYNPTTVSFTSDKSEGSRSVLYQKMFNRFLPNGLKLTRKDDPSSHNDHFEIIKESMDSSYPLDWDEDENGVTASFTTADGSEVIAKFDHYTKPEYWEMEFKRNGSTKMTGEGDAMKILSTFFKAAKEFIADYKPKFFGYSANMKDESRVSVYKKAFERMIKNTDYVNATDRLDQLDHPYMVKWYPAKKAKVGRGDQPLYARKDMFL